MADRTLAIATSLGVHALAFALLTVSFHAPPARLPAAPPQMEAVETVAVDEAAVERELQKLRSDEQARRNAETARQRKLAREADQMRRAREQEAQRLAELKKKRDQEQRERKAAEAAETKRLADLKAEQQRVAAEKAAIEKQRAEEAKKVAELERQRKLAEERDKAARAAALKAKLDAEAKALEREQASLNSRLKAEYVDLIANKVSRNWLRPAGTSGSVDCQVFVRQLPGGEVVDVRLLQSCGSPALDRSVEAAVRKASPLPAPPTPDVFDREIKFRFHTER
ncbi:MAG: cell envelope integrity protein TolA [Thiohalomonadaceae bacterium]